jgi:hypothetical protein
LKIEIRQLNQPDAEALWDLRPEAREPMSFGESPDELRKVTVRTYAERLASGGVISRSNFAVRGLLCSLLGRLRGAARELPELGMAFLNVVTPQPALSIRLGPRSFGIEPRALCVEGRYIDEVLELWQTKEAGRETS